MRRSRTVRSTGRGPLLYPRQRPTAGRATEGTVRRAAKHAHSSRNGAEHAYTMIIIISIIISIIIRSIIIISIIIISIISMISIIIS